ncbi:hypothetical protein GCL60_16935 (plasmid) [Silvanigrella paludirubra]|uniref:Uncharacterized protein n=1 Tax=Silvanigrella paludirubra TaxID=2499159 RepID=A0A6N6VP31_9BACT|nr:hypothetical protein [Silvanigrella paludirubra]KAB8035633.1 hypothetical protein GCL60_16935 [Silvanigrella paludirubra]
MNNYDQISGIYPKDIIAYIKQHGWKLENKLQTRSIELYNNSNFKNRQLQIPTSTGLDDYPQLLVQLAEKLSTIENRSYEQIINDWRSADSDIIRIKLKTKDEYQIPFSRALQTMESTKKAIIASACSILSPQKHHAKLRRTEANELMDACKMEQTEKGSFIIKLSCPIYAVNYDVQIAGSVKEIPFVRMATIGFMKSLRDIKELASNDNDENEIPDSLSSNFCSAIRNILEDEVEFSAFWALNLEQTDKSVLKSIILKPDLIPQIERLEARLRPTPPSQNHAIYGTVENLDGQIGDDNKRSGDVTIKFIHDDEILFAKVILNSEQHEIAIEAYRTGVYVKVTGFLKRGIRSNRIEKVENFDLAEKLK